MLWCLKTSNSHLEVSHIFPHISHPRSDLMLTPAQTSHSSDVSLKVRKCYSDCCFKNIYIYIIINSKLMYILDSVLLILLFDETVICRNGIPEPV